MQTRRLISLLIPGLCAVLGCRTPIEIEDPGAGAPEALEHGDEGRKELGRDAPELRDALPKGSEGSGTPSSMADRFPLYGGEDAYAEGAARPSAGGPGAGGTAPEVDPWPMFQGGPGHAGHSDDERLLVPLLLKWRVSAGGRLEASPIAAGGYVYGARSDGVAVAVDFDTGKLAWQARLDGAVIGTPAVSRGTLFVPSLDGNLYAIDASTGSVRKRFGTQPPGERDRGLAGTRKPSVLASAVVDQSSVYFAGHDGQLYQVDAEKLEIVSVTPLPGPVRGGIAIAGDRAVAACATGELAAVRIGHGAEAVIWRVKLADPGPDAFRIPPAIVKGTVLASAGRDRFVFARRLSDGQMLWGHQFDGQVVAFASDGERVYVSAVPEDKRSSVTAVSLSAGTRLWKARLPGSGVGPPVVANGQVFVGTSGTVQCLVGLDADTGEMLWQAREFGAVSVGPAPHRGSLVVATDSGFLAAYEAGDVLGSNPLIPKGELLPRPFVDWVGVVSELDWRSARWAQRGSKVAYRMSDFALTFKPNDDASPWQTFSKPMIPMAPFLLSPTYTGLTFPSPGKGPVRIVGVRGLDRPGGRFYNVRVADRTRVLTALIVARRFRGEWRPIYVNNWFTGWTEGVVGAADKAIAGYYVNRGAPFGAATRIDNTGTFGLLSAFDRALVRQAPRVAVARGALSALSPQGEVTFKITHYWGGATQTSESRLLFGDPERLRLLQLHP